MKGGGWAEGDGFVRGREGGRTRGEVVGEGRV